MIELFFAAEVVLGSGGAGIGKEFVHILAIRVAIRELLAHINDGYGFHLVRLSAFNDVWNLLVIDGQAFARLGEVGLLGGFYVAVIKLRYAVVIGGLQATE